MLTNILNSYILISIGTTAENEPQVAVILNPNSQAESVSSVQLSYYHINLCQYLNQRFASSCGLILSSVSR